MSNKYETLLESVNELQSIETQNITDKTELDAFQRFLMANWKIISRYEKTVGEIESYLESFDINNSKSSIGITNQLEALIREYKSERYRMFRGKDIWKDDRQRLECDMNIGNHELNAKIEEAIAKKKKDIHNTINEYKWLRRGDYRKKHNSIISEEISYREYQKEIDKLKERRDKWLKDNNIIMWECIGLSLALAVLIAVFLTVVVFDTFEFELGWFIRIPIGVVSLFGVGFLFRLLFKVIFWKK